MSEPLSREPERRFTFTTSSAKPTAKVRCHNCGWTAKGSDPRPSLSDQPIRSLIRGTCARCGRSIDGRAAARMLRALRQCETLSEHNGCETQPTLAQLQQVVIALQESEAEMMRDRDLADRECRRLRKEADLLRRQLLEAQEADPKSKEIRAVLDYWLERIGPKRARGTKTPAGGERWSKVKARLNDTFTAEELKRAVDGAMLMPFVGPRGRVSEHGPGCQREDDIELVCRNEKNVERFMGYAAPKVEPLPARPSLTLVPGLSPLDRVLATLPKGRFSPEGVMTTCPLCDASLFVRALKRPSGELVVMDCYGVSKCDGAELLLALGLDGGDLFECREVLNEFPAPFRLSEHLASAMRSLLALGVVGEEAA